ncbi:Autoantigen NGP 1 [Trichuris trichiura]|uniref:Nucleolar GTP-binding protein 2 n=1 Tax=Trichuris trichiura TaxID=36087 RepID=A0A077ZBL1_TRITR|nr:Autoantigen NGP 1 [Trichuris trichiura]
MGTRKKARKPMDRVSHAKHSLNPDRSNKGGKGFGQLRSSSTVRRLLMYKNFKAKYNRHGKMVQAAPFQGTLKSGTMARVEPNRRWFGNTRVIGQEDLQKFQENLGKAIADPYSFVLRQTKLPITLLAEKRKNVRSHVLDTEAFHLTFGPKAQRKKPKIVTDDLQEMITDAESKHERYDEDEDVYRKRGVDKDRYEPQDPLFRKGQSKRIWNELYKVLDSSDVVLEVLDARDPMGTRCFNVEKFLKKEKPHKHLLLVLNKVDLIPKWATKRWIRQLSSEYPTIAFRADLKNPFGKGALINVLRQLAKLHSDRQQISVGFVGFPNVGKSSIINALRSKKVCNVAPIAGETKVWQYVTLMRQIYLIDCPGIVYPTGNSEEQLILKGVVRVENVKEPSEYIEHVLHRVRREYLVRTYQVDKWSTADEFLTALCNRNGRLLKGGEPDVNASARMVLNDFQRGKLPYYVLPPDLDRETEAKRRSGEKDLVDRVRVHQNIAQVTLSAEFVDEDKKNDLTESEADNNSEAVSERQSEFDLQNAESCSVASDVDSCSGLSGISGMSDLDASISDEDDELPKVSKPPITRRKGGRAPKLAGKKKMGKQAGIVDFTQEPISAAGKRQRSYLSVIL